MSTTYNGASFDVLIPDGFRPEWEQQPLVSDRPIPYGNTNDVQIASRGNFALTLDVKITNDTDVAVLQSSVGTTARTLGAYYGTDYSGVILKSVTKPRRLANSANWFCTLTFTRAGS